MAGVQPSVQTGEVIAGRYRVEKILGVGAMGTVAAAWDTRDNVRRALKVMHTGPDGEATWVERFRREGQVGRNLKSEHTVRVMDAGGFEEGKPYLVMEHLEGTDLGRLLRSRGPLSIGDAVLWVSQACEAIAEAHDIGVVHRDLKPQNLFLTRRRDGSSIVKVLDFGISKVVLLGPDDVADVTKTGELLGSPAYMAPEQIRASSKVDKRSDVWALGVILYELLTGRWPFPAKVSLEVIAMVLERTPDPPSTHRPDLPPALQTILMRCLEKDPDKRIQSASDLQLALVPFTPHELNDDESTVVMPHRPRMPSVGERGTLRMPPGPDDPETLPLASPSVAPPPESTGSSASVAMPATTTQAPASIRSLLIGTPQRATATAGAALWLAAAITLIALRRPADLGAQPSESTSASAVVTVAATTHPSASGAPRTSADPSPVPSSEPVANVEPSTAAGEPAAASEGRGERPGAHSALPAKTADEPVSSNKGGTREIDQVAAMAALGSAAGAARRCKKPGGPKGSSRVEVTFGTSGRVTSARVGAPFEGTSVGKCILAAFYGAAVPPFVGSTFSAGKTVTIK